MLGYCNYVNDNNNHCSRTYNLHTIIFRDPYAASHLEQIDLCKWHYDIISDEFNTRIRDYQMLLSNKIAESARLRKTARENDIYINNELGKQRIEDLRALIKKLSNNECRNYFCMNDLTKLEKNKKIYSVHTFKPNGKRHLSLYFCCLKCFNIMKGKCGIQSTIRQGQYTL